MNLIQNIREPHRLLLCWQAPEGKDRTLFTVAELQKKNNEYLFRYLKNTRDFERATDLGFTIYPPFKINPELYNSGVLEAFMRRITPRTRNDFAEYLEEFRIPNNVQIDDFTLLGYTGAKLPSDGFLVVNPFDDIEIPAEMLVELAGTRYIKTLNMKLIHKDDEVVLIPEPTNGYDQDAIRCMVGSHKIGYIKKGQTTAFHRWLSDKSIVLTANIERINGNADRPIIYVFVKLREK
ncbi:MAG: HIRAN domain-containing protein [Candidatus Aureabacteria bacterium]|nr:HIRAN domain-containing protein [Candidatus Auribacterota bacterium]